MSEQVEVQVREGVWRTRDGQEAEVRSRDLTGIESFEWRWEGKRHGHMVTWRDDGTIHIERRTSNGDLMQFLRPLPEAEAEQTPEPEPQPEPEPVQVRAGVWLTRDGAHVEVQANHTANAAELPWRGMLCGVSEIWHDDGRWRISGGDHYRDLVQYVGPLPEQAAPEPEVEPEPQPTSELQPEQVCKGLWKTRSGQLVEVRARQDRVQTQYRWIGSIFGVAHRWRDDGRKFEGRDHHCDLVLYVGSLPETEEQAGETLQETLGQALEQAYIADLKKALDAVTADRDRLQQAHQTMTEHAREFLESGQQARDERDNLQQQLEAATAEGCRFSLDLYRMTGERDNLRTQLAAMDSLEQQLATMTRERDILAVDADMCRLTCKRVRADLATITSERDEVANELRAMTDHCSRQQEQLQALTEKREQLTVLLSNAQCAHDVQQRQVQQLQAEARAVNELLQNERLEAQQAHAGRKRAEENLEAMTAHCDRLASEINTAERESGKTADEAAHQEGFDNGQSWAFQVMYTWVQPLAGASRDESPGLIRALPGLIRRLAEREGVVI
jgi:hypothetical protein